MIKQFFVLIVIIFFGGCAVSSSKDIKDHAPLVRACIDSQLLISNPIWDQKLKKPQGQVEDYVVEISSHPDLSFVTVEIKPAKIYPDAPLSLCRVNKVTYDPMYAAFYLGELGSEHKEESFVDDTVEENLNHSDLDKFVVEMKTKLFSLANFY